MSSNIFLVGYMGAGKSTVAGVLHEKYGFEVIEMDQRITEMEGKSVSEIFSEKGEAYFRDLETSFLHSIKKDGGAVISTGGGAPMRECNALAMRENGLVVYLTVKPETVLERVRHDTGRPLLDGNINFEYITGMLSRRDPKYRAAAHVCIATDGRSPEEIADEIAADL